MNSFILISLLVCPSGQELPNGHDWGCYETKDLHVRQSVIKQYEEFDYIECKEGYASNIIQKCKKQVIAGCEFTLDDGTKLDSSLSCPGDQT